MANDLNLVTLIGRATKDPELKTTQGGASVLRFSIANNRKKKSGDQWVDEVNYFDIVVWGKKAETLHKYINKGTQLSVEGELKQNRWEQDGQQRSKVEVNAHEIQLLGSSSTSTNNAPQPANIPTQEPSFSGGDYDGADIPF